MSSQSIKTESFKNEASKRFHAFFYPKLKDKEIDSKKFFDDFAISYGNPMQFFSGLRYGDRSVTIEHIEVAYKKYGLQPNYLFGVSEVAAVYAEYAITSTVNDNDSKYDLSVGEKLKLIFEKHKTNISQYAEERLHMSEQNLYKILRGDGRPYWDLLVAICEDHGESLDQFRNKPLPKGHLLQQVKTQQLLIDVLQKRVSELEASK